MKWAGFLIKNWGLFGNNNELNSKFAVSKWKCTVQWLFPGAIYQYKCLFWNFVVRLRSDKLDKVLNTNSLAGVIDPWVVCLVIGSGKVNVLVWMEQ